MKLFRLSLAFAISMGIAGCGDMQAREISHIQSTSTATPMYRFWRGWKKPGVENFQRELAERFMPATPATHAKNGLKSYLVATPPAEHDSFIPDEIALVTYASKEAYEKAKTTPEGKVYADMHWDVFDKSNSASLVPEKFSGQLLELEKAYDVLGTPVDFQKGVNTFYIGLKKPSVSENDFRKQLTQHVAHVARVFEPQGMRAYMVLVSGQYEIAIQNWTSAAALEKAMKKNGAEVSAEAEAFMDHLMFKQSARDFDSTLTDGDWVNVKFERPEEYSSHSNRMPTKKALIVVTSHSDMGANYRKTGYYMPEVAHPYEVLQRHGYTIDIASPKGGKAPVDEYSLRKIDEVTKAFMASPDFSKLSHTIPLSKIKPEKYDTVIFAGGHGTMFDLPRNADVQRISTQIYRQGGYVAAICHGPSALLNLRLPSGAYLITGKDVAGFTNLEEKEVELTAAMPFSLEDSLKARGGSYSSTPNWQPHVQVTSRVVTGQNPGSAGPVAEKIVELLSTKVTMKQPTPKMIAGVIDHTFLKTEKEGVDLPTQEKKVRELVQQAIEFGAYSVCVRENWVKLAKQLVAGTNVKVTSVIGFPDGDAFSTAEKVALLKKAQADGADEFDMVMRYNDFKDGKIAEVKADVAAVSAAAGSRVLKVIFENAYLTDSEKPRAYAAVIEALDSSKAKGPRFLKTSTGFATPAAGVAVGATLADVRLMQAQSQGRFGIKPAGGVKDLKGAIEFFTAVGSPWIRDQSGIDPMKYRIGSSALLMDLFSEKKTGSDY